MYLKKVYLRIADNLLETQLGNKNLIIAFDAGMQPIAIRALK